ncbi:response regulator [Brevundimonas sp.]|uniref:response regulator n=1 Tax=Brevundimonas sp. TaxID=1871086 RepID=UPI002604AC94|nr:response regulator [Brevundimonas sp.]
MVDDNAHVRLILMSVLASVGLNKIRQACDGTEALEILRTRTFDFAIVDYSMAPMNGLEFTRFLRNPGSVSPHLPIIMVTGHSEQEHVFKARDAGVNEFLVKPIVPAAVLKRVEMLVFHPRPFISGDTYFGPDRRRAKRDGPLNMGRRSTDAFS